MVMMWIRAYKLPKNWKNLQIKLGLKFSTKVSIIAISLGIISVGIAFAVISNSDEAKIRELIFAYQIALNNEEIEKMPTL